MTTKPQHLEDDAAVDLHASVERVVINWLGLQPPLSGPFAAKLVEGFRSEMGGKRIYIPSARQRNEDKIKTRDQQIVAMFNGRNLKEVMRVFGVSRRTVYNAVARAKLK